MVNMILRDGHRIMIDRTFNTTPTYLVPKKFKVGTGETAPNYADEDLENPVEITLGEESKDIAIDFPQINLANMEVSFRFFLDLDEANDNEISEVGIFSGSTIYSKASIFPKINKTDAVQVAFVQKDRLRAQ